MITISVKSDLAEQVSLFSRVAHDQVPFATALALTRAAQAAKAEVELQMPAFIDRPTAYSLRGFRLYRATKTKLRAEVDFRPAFGRGTNARDYLSPMVYGGARKLKAFERSLQSSGLLPSGYMAMPGSAAKMDAHGNMSRGQIVQILSYFKAFGEQGYSANMTDAKRERLAKGSKRTGQRGISYFVGKPGGGKLPLGVWQKTSFGAAGSAIKPVIIYGKAPVYRKLFDVETIAKRAIEVTFPEELKKAMQVALATRR